MKKRIASTALILLMLLALNTSAYAETDKQALYESYVESIADCYGIQPEFIEAICFVESSWRPSVTNGKCVGLMQVNPYIHAERMNKLGVTDLTDAYSNILVGTDYLAELVEEYGEPYEVLMIYNMGNRGKELYEQGIYSKYAEEVCELSEELERAHGK